MGIESRRDDNHNKEGIKQRKQLRKTKSDSAISRFNRDKQESKDLPQYKQLRKTKSDSAINRSNSKAKELNVKEDINDMREKLSSLIEKNDVDTLDSEPLSRPQSVSSVDSVNTLNSVNSIDSNSTQNTLINDGFSTNKNNKLFFEILNSDIYKEFIDQKEIIFKYYEEALQQTEDISNTINIINDKSSSNLSLSDKGYLELLEYEKKLAESEDNQYQLEEDLATKEDIRAKEDSHGKFYENATTLFSLRENLLEARTAQIEQREKLLNKREKLSQENEDKLAEQKLMLKIMETFLDNNNDAGLAEWKEKFIETEKDLQAQRDSLAMDDKEFSKQEKNLKKEEEELEGEREIIGRFREEIETRQNNPSLQLEDDLQNLEEKHLEKVKNISIKKEIADKTQKFMNEKKHFLMTEKIYKKMVKQGVFATNASIEEAKNDLSDIEKSLNKTRDEYSNRRKYFKLQKENLNSQKGEIGKQKLRLEQQKENLEQQKNGKKSFFKRFF